ncbi:MAG: hypothetical protein ACTS2F_07800 [Thainema sp.]
MKAIHSWYFVSELALEDFVCANLWPLLRLQPLARQYAIDGQICDILALSPQQQLVIIELKNVEDRYVIPQLTRYYASLAKAQPFADHVDYSQLIRLLAIAPSFHVHNLIDRDYSQLNFDCLTFQVTKTDRQELMLTLTDLDQNLIGEVAIAPLYRRYLQAEDKEIEPEPIRQIGPPPKSLRKLLDTLPPEQQQEWLTVREQILNFDERIAEVGRSTTTQYGLRKGNTEVYKTKLCAEILTKGTSQPHLMLRLPYPKREFGAPGRTYKKQRVLGFTWATVPLPYQFQHGWQVSYHLGKSRLSASFTLQPSQLALMHQQLTGQIRQVTSTQDIVELALEQWVQQFL